MLALVEVNKQTERNASFVLFLDSKASCTVPAGLAFVSWLEKEKQARFNMFLLGLSQSTHAKWDQN